MNFDAIPQELRALPQWVCFGAQGTQPGTREWKKPYNPATGRPAKAGKPGTWTDFETARTAVAMGLYAGIGFEFADDGGLVGIDFDHCLQNGQVASWAASWVQRLNSYTEVSPSGTGLHVICRGRLPGPALKTTSAEMYDRGRFFTVTGDVYGPAQPPCDAQAAINELYVAVTATRPQGKQAAQTPTEPLQSVVQLTDDEITRIASNAQNGELFRALFAGQWAGRYPSQSEADLALCNLLAFYTSRDAEQMDRIFRRSGLARDKWDRPQSGSTYGALTITNAIQHCTQVFDPRTTAAEDFGGAPATATEPLLVALSSVQSVETRWLWRPYVPLGKITLMEADPGTGKTYMALSMAAVVSSGGRFYGEPDTVCRAPANVVYQSAEDGLADTIKPRMETLIPQPDFGRIFVIDEHQKGLTLLDRRIETTLQRIRPALFILDPLQAYLGATVDMHRANEVRPVLAQIARLAEQYECAFLIVMHMNKDSQGQALYRALGSIDIPAVARSMIFLGKNPNNTDQRIMCHEKSSLAPRGESLVFRIWPEFGGVAFVGTSDMSADDVLHAKAKTRNKPAVTLTNAMQLLNNLLGETGAAPLEEVENLQTSAEISQRTMYNAKNELELQTVRIGRPPHRHVWWISPETDKEKFIEAHKPISEQNENRPP